MKKIYLEKFQIVGLFHSNLMITAWTTDPTSTIILSIGNKKDILSSNVTRDDVKKYLNKTDDKNYGFSYNISIPTFTRKIELIIDNKNYLLSNDFFLKIAIQLKKVIKNIFKGFKILLKNPRIIFSKKLLNKYINIFFAKCGDKEKVSFLNPFNKEEYLEWIINNEKFDNCSDFKKNPLISFIIPVYNPRLDEFKECIDSIQNQTYKNYEICVCDDCSTNSDIVRMLNELKEKKIIKLVRNNRNMHISNSSNNALKIATGDYVALIDDDDVISPFALSECVKEINKCDVDFIYSDNDKLDKSGDRCDPYFKPDFSPDTLLSLNYLSHFNVIKKMIILKAGSFRASYDGAQDYDLFLRITEITSKIVHVSKILYHWRMSESSTSSSIKSKNYAIENGKKAIQDALIRRKLVGKVITNKNSSFYNVIYNVDDNPLVSIIIPTKDHADLLKNCVYSILEKTTYDNYEIIIVDNGSSQSDALLLLKNFKQKYKNIKIIKWNHEFNYSKINNLAVDEVNGEYLVLLNNDTKLITPNWLELMLGYAQLEHVGTVGVKLLYSDSTIQHGGVVIGLGGVASHAFLGLSRYDKGVYGSLECPNNVAAVTAACFMVKISKYLEVGGLNELLKVAYNDIDFNLKLLEKKYFNVFLPNVELYHYESKSRGLDTTDEKYTRFLEESNYMYNKWDKYIKRDPFYNQNYSLKSSYRLDKLSIIDKK